MAISVDIQKKYSGFGLDVRFESAGRRIGILGGSGSGKSMTLRSIAGIHRPDAGRIVLDGRVLLDTAGRVDLKPQVRRVGYLFQNYALFPNMSVRDNIMAGMKGKKNENTARADALIRRFRLEGLEDRLPSRLSGGQQQRVALARILASEPDAILLDEPFSALDWYLKDQMQRELTGMLADYEGTVILVSHDRDEIYRFSEELLVISGGKIIRQGPTREVFADPGSRDAAALTGCKNFSRARRVDDHRAEALDWGITLSFCRPVPADLRYLGFRAHEFLPVWLGPGESRPGNAIRCRVISEARLQFEHNYYIAPEGCLSGKRGEAVGSGEAEAALSGGHLASGKSCAPPGYISGKREITPGSKEAGSALNSAPPADGGTAEPLSWFAQRDRWAELAEKGLPDYLVLPEEAVLFLQ